MAFAAWRFRRSDGAYENASVLDPSGHARWHPLPNSFSLPLLIPWEVVFYLPGIFSFLVLASGWYYIFYSPAAHRLSAVEAQGLNRFRIRLRRCNGVVMMLLAIVFYAAVYTAEPRSHALVWLFMGILFLLAAMLVLALVDLQLTRRLRRRQKKDQS